MRRVALSMMLALGCNEPFDPIAASADKVVVLVFMTTECPISNRYAPTLKALHERFRDRGVELVGVYPDPDDDEYEVTDHRRGHGLGFRGVRDPEHAFVRLAGVSVTPEAAVYSAGTLVYRGRIDDRAVAFGNFRPQAQHDDLANAIEATLVGSTVEPSRTDAVGCYIEDLQ